MHTRHQSILDTSRKGSTPSLSHLSGKIRIVLLELGWSFGKEDNDGIDRRGNGSQKDAAQDESNHKTEAVYDIL